MADLNKIFELWLDTGVISKQDEKHLLLDPELCELYQNAKNWQKQSTYYKESAVPDWNRESTWFGKNTEHTKFSGFNWFNGAVLSLSILLCVLVVNDTHLSVNEHGFEISFNGQNKVSQQQQIAELKQMFVDIQKQNNKHTWQMVQQAIDTGRLERSEDMTQLVKHFNEQRNQDQVLIKLQLNDLAEQVENQSSAIVAQNILEEK